MRSPNGSVPTWRCSTRYGYRSSPRPGSWRRWRSWTRAGVPATGHGAVGGDGQFKPGEPFRLAGVVAQVGQGAGAQHGRVGDPDGELGRLDGPVGEAGGEVADPAGHGLGVVARDVAEPQPPADTVRVIDEPHEEGHGSRLVQGHARYLLGE